MRSVNVKVYDEEWVVLGTGVVYHSLEEEDEKATRVVSCVWGRFLDDHPRYRDVDFYRLNLEDDTVVYVRADEEPTYYHSVMFPACKNSKPTLVDENGKKFSEEEMQAYKKRKVYLKR